MTNSYYFLCVRQVPCVNKNTLFICIVALLFFSALPKPVLSEAPSPNIDPYAVRLFQHPNYVGQSFDVTLHPDQHYVFINILPGDIDNQASSIAVGEKVGAILFASPDFSGKEENIISSASCADSVGSWYNEVTKNYRESVAHITRVDDEPDWYNPFDGPAHTAGLGDRVSSMIVYRKKDIGGFIGAEFVNDDRNLEMTRLFDGGTCEYTRWFFPVPLPKKSTCYNLKEAAHEKSLLLHGNYLGAKPKARLYADRDCKGESITFPDPILDARNIRLHLYGWENKAKSIEVFLESGKKVAGAVSMNTEPKWVEKNSRRKGKAFFSFQLDKDDPEACRRACESELKCRAYSHIGTKVMAAAVGKSVPEGDYDFSKTIKASCEMYDNVPPRTALDGAMSGVKSFKGVGRHTFVKPTSFGSRINVCAPALGKQCGKPVAEFYCKQQGFFTAEAFTENTKKQFETITCTNTVSMKPLPGRTAGPTAVFTPKQIEGKKVEDVRCADYAKSAVQQQEENIAKQCGYKGPEWNPEYKAHYDWCMTAPPEHVAAGTKMRADALQVCLANTPEARCDAYAKKAVAQYQENVDKKCGYYGLPWLGDYKAHYAWCLTVPKNISDMENLKRDQALANCPTN